MNVTEAHTRLVRLAATYHAGDWPAVPVRDRLTPLAMTALASMHGGLEDAADDAELVALASEMFALMGVTFDESRLCGAMVEVLLDLYGQHVHLFAGLPVGETPADVLA